MKATAMEYTLLLFPTSLFESLTAAIEFSLLYLFAGGGLVGAIVVFVIAKMLRR